MERFQHQDGGRDAVTTEKNEAVARYFDRIGTLEHEDELFEATAGLLKETGWVQGHNAVNENGTETGGLAHDAARFSVSSALIRTSSETGLDRTMAVKTAIDRLADRIRASHPRAHAFEADDNETRPTVRNLTVVMAWNNDPGQTLHEVVRTLLENPGDSEEPRTQDSDTGTITPEAAPEPAHDDAQTAEPADDISPSNGAADEDATTEPGSGPATGEHREPLPGQLF